MDTRSVATPAGTLEAHAIGSGDLAIVLVGGPGLSCAYARPLARIVAEHGLRAVVFQPRGIPSSTWPEPVDFTLNALAKDVDAVRRAYDGERAHIIAHSFGGYVAWALCADASTVASLTLIGACSPSAAVNAAGEARLKERIGARSAGDPTARFHAALPSYFHDPARAFHPALLATTVHEDVQRAVVGAGSGMAALADHARCFEGRAAVFVGRSDPLGVAMAEANRDALSSADVRYEVIPDAGHFPWLEPCDFADRLGVWLTSLASP